MIYNEKVVKYIVPQSNTIQSCAARTSPVGAHWLSPVRVTWISCLR